MNNLIKYAIIGAAGYAIGQLTIKYRMVRYALDLKLERDKECKEGDEAQ
jgi:hypothetical protein